MKFAGDLDDKIFSMNINRVKLIPFKKAKPGTSAFRTADVFPEGFASKRALSTINSHPELLVSYFAYRYSQQRVFHPTPYRKAIELASANAHVCAVIGDNTALIKREDSSPVRFFSPQECRSLKTDEKVDVSAYPHAGRAIDISSRLDGVFMALDDALIGERKSETDRPTFIPSVPLKTYEWLFRISQMYGLKDRDSLDLGSGIGTEVFLASLFCRSAAGVEKHPSLHASALELENALRKDRVIDVPVNLMCEDFTGNFDMSPYSFIYTYKPFLADPEKILSKLREARPGTLILADLLPQILFDSNFKKITSLGDYCQGNTTFLMVRE